MSSLAVVEHFDVIEDLCASFFSAGEPAMMDEFVLQIAEEAFDHGVVVAVPLAAHADCGADLLKPSLIDDAHIGRAAVAVMDQPGIWLALIKCHLKRVQA